MADRGGSDRTRNRRLRAGAESVRGVRRDIFLRRAAAGCWCEEVKLTKQVLRELRGRHADCLCPAMSMPQRQARLCGSASEKCTMTPIRKSKSRSGAIGRRSR